MDCKLQDKLNVKSTYDTSLFREGDVINLLQFSNSRPSSYTTEDRPQHWVVCVCGFFLYVPEGD